MTELHIERYKSHYAVQLRENTQDTTPAEVAAPIDWRHAPDWTIERLALGALTEEVLRLRDDAVKSSNEIANLRGDVMRLELQSRIESFRTYPENWDGAGAEPPSADTIQAAIKFTKNLPTGSPRPHMSLTPEGEINFKWAWSAEAELRVAICSDTIYFYSGVINGEEFDFLGGSELLDQRLPSVMLALLMDSE